MIRRDDGDDWLLISQVDHAHLAGEIAAVWGREPIAPLPLSEWLLVAVRDHDEGWRQWEERPTVDPATGRPREFLEMPMEEATAIWRRSIAACDVVPMARLWVSRHFQYLARLARDSREGDDREVDPLERFLAEQAVIERADRAAYASLPELGGRYEEFAEQGFRFVQMFDRMSLWLCCAERTSPQDFQPPEGSKIRWTPQLSDGTPGAAIGLPSSANSRSGNRMIVAEPYPLSVERLELSVPAQRIPAIRYADDATYQQALASASIEQLRWTIAAK